MVSTIAHPEAAAHPIPISTTLVAALLGLLIMIVGGSSLAKGKGYSPYLGALAGLGVIGVVILGSLSEKKIKR